MSQMRTQNPRLAKAPLRAKIEGQGEIVGTFVLLEPLANRERKYEADGVEARELRVMKIEARSEGFTLPIDATIHVAPDHDHGTHALRNIGAIASFYEAEDDARDALEAIISIAQRGLSTEIPKAS